MRISIKARWILSAAFGASAIALISLAFNYQAIEKPRSTNMLVHQTQDTAGVPRAITFTPPLEPQK